MGIFAGLEGSLEKYIEGFFKDAFGRGCVQPVEIAKSLAREMRDRRRVSISHIYVPNQYTVHLSPADWAMISNFSTMLSGELQDYIDQKAKGKKYTLVDKPSVSFQQDDNLAGGILRVESAFSGTTFPAEPDATGNDTGHTMRFFPVKDITRQEPGTMVHGILEVVDGPGQGKVFPLREANLLIGRHQTCQVVLDDTSVSRSHARLELRRGRYTLRDLGSTNGTYVNGVRINSKKLAPGDVLTLGTTVCTLKVE